MRISIIISLLFLLISFNSCNTESADKKEIKVEDVENERIISLSGNISEVLYALGVEKSIVGVDVTSTYPESLKDIPNLGHSSKLSAESIASLNPTILLGFKDEVDPTLLEQLETLGLKFILFDKPVKIEEASDFITKVAKTIGKEEVSKNVVSQLKEDLKTFKPLESSPKVIFIYARGLGTLMVAGKNTAQSSLIEFVGAQNAATFEEGFKTLTAEALVDANPDIILMFNSGYESLNATNDLMNVPGIKETNAGINGNFITMDGQLLSCLGPRSGEALSELKSKIESLNN